MLLELGLRCITAAALVMHGLAHAEPLAWRDAQELVLVVIDDWHADHGTLQTFTRAAPWKAADVAKPVTIGKHGAAWGAGLHPAQPGPVKQEGDGRSPAGVFTIGAAFGYTATTTTALPYQQMQVSHYCVDVPNSPLYNRIVDTQEVGASAVVGSTEPMRRDLHFQGDQGYRLGFVIEHNRDGRSGLGSCIFGHLWKAPGASTAGCTAMDVTTMQQVLSFLHPAHQPIFVLLPRPEYYRLREAWMLPAIDP